MFKAVLSKVTRTTLTDLFTVAAQWLALVPISGYSFVTDVDSLGRTQRHHSAALAAPLRYRTYHGSGCTSLAHQVLTVRSRWIHFTGGRRVPTVVVRHSLLRSVGVVLSVPISLDASMHLLRQVIPTQHEIINHGALDILLHWLQDNIDANQGITSSTTRIKAQISATPAELGGCRTLFANNTP